MSETCVFALHRLLGIHETLLQSSNRPQVPSYSDEPSMRSDMDGRVADRNITTL